MTIDLPIQQHIRYIRQEAASYRSLYSPEENSVLVDLCKRVFKREYTNEGAVRLERCDCDRGETALTLSPVFFYDFLTSTFLLFSMDRIMREADERERALVTRLKERYDGEAPIDSLQKLLAEGFLSNILAVSCLIRDRRDRFLITRRNGKVGISSNFYSTTVTGSVDHTDLKADNPLVNCCVREVAEELGLALDPSAIRIHTIAAGIRKLQPIVLADAAVEDLEAVLEAIGRHKDFSLEHNQCAIVTRERLRLFLSDENALITEAARTHLEGAIR